MQKIMTALDFHVSYYTADGNEHKLCSSLNKKIDPNYFSDLQNNNFKNTFMPFQYQYKQDDEMCLKVDISNTYGNDTSMYDNSIVGKYLLGQSDKCNRASIEDPLAVKFNSLKYKNIINYLKENIGSLNVISNYNCSLCGYKCKYEAIFTNHLISHGVENNAQLNVLKSTKSLDKYKCSKCKYKTTNKAMYNKHVRKSKHYALSCLECKEKFGSTFDLHKHKLTHALGSEFACPLCDYKGQKIIELKKHLSKHSEKRLFSCSKCEFASSRIFTLEKHMLSHTEKAADVNKDKTKVITNGTKIKTNIIQDYDRRKFPDSIISSGILKI